MIRMIATSRITGTLANPGILAFWHLSIIETSYMTKNIRYVVPYAPSHSTIFSQQVITCIMYSYVDIKVW
jgi:hypothetical protein